MTCGCNRFACPASAQVLDATPTLACVQVSNGSSVVLEFDLADGQDNPVDISLDTIRFSVREERQGDLVIQKENGPGDHLDPTQGRTTFSLVPADYPAQTDQQVSLVYEVRRIRPGLEETVHLEGPFIVELAVGGATP